MLQTSMLPLVKKNSASRIRTIHGGQKPPELSPECPQLSPYHCSKVRMEQRAQTQGVMFVSGSASENLPYNVDAG